MYQLRGIRSTVVEEYNDMVALKKLLNIMDDDKEYILGIGHHAAVVRKTKGQYEYLELQDEPSHNGYIRATSERFAQRFALQKSYSAYGMKYKVESWLVDVNSFKDGEEDFIKMMGYINTQEGKQLKGQGGSIK